MRLRLIPLFVTLFVCAFAAGAQTVSESESSIIFNEKAAELSLVIENPTASANTKIEIELLDAESKVRAAASPVVRLKNGKQTYKISIPVGDLMKAAGDDLAWFRLRYRVGNNIGLISLSELLKDDFELRVAAFERVMPGSDFRVRIRALNPLTKRPIRKVIVDGLLKLDLDNDAEDNELSIKAHGETNSDGILSLNFAVPAGVKLDDDPKLTINGKKGGIVRSVDEEIDSDEVQASVFLTADKPLYQPGQSFNVRGLYFDSNNVAVAGSDLKFSIEDEDDTVLYRETVKTSDFGIASISWTIPENAKLGNYHVIVDADADLSADQLIFKVSRYDLPNFAISTTPDKPYYLPDDKQAQITIAGDYLFGKPVNKGKVRVVQESDRRWNWRAQKYESDEEDAVEGDTDPYGKYIAKFDLTSYNKELQDSQWRQYTDLRFAAYYTDLSTNRTEQKRFDIRLTKEPIHVYLVRHDYQNPNLPLTAYVATFYADGTPAVCNIEVKDSTEIVDRFKTNSLGAGKFEINIPPDLATARSFNIKIVARDKKGRIGSRDDEFYLDGKSNALRLTTKQTIYKPGDAVEVSIESTQKTGYIYVDMVKDWSVMDSHIVKLRNGKADLSVPYRPEFKGELTIAAYSDQETSYYGNRMRSSRGIIFPEQQNLKVNAKFSGETFRPNQEATLNFSVFNGSGRPAESALGVVLFDKAIEQRAKTDAEFGSYFSRFYGLMGYDKSFGSIALKDINDLDLTQPVSPEMELAAEVMLAGNYYYPHIYSGGGNDSEVQSLYEDYFKSHMKPVGAALKKQFEIDHIAVSDEETMSQMLRQNGIDLDSLVDPWGQKYKATFSTAGSQAILSLSTSGPDKLSGNGDDYVVLTVGVSYFEHIGANIDQAALNYHNLTNGYIRDLSTLSSELAKLGVDLASVKDRWGRSYRITFETIGRKYLIRFYSNGPNGYYEPTYYKSDDIDLWKTSTDYFIETENKINEILNKEVNFGKKPFPTDAGEFAGMLRRNGLDLRTILDGYGRPVMTTMVVRQRYTDKTTYENGKQTIVPMSDELREFIIRTKGVNVESDLDDLEIARFSSVITEAGSFNRFSKAEVDSIAFSGAKGAIRGNVVDPNGAVISGAEAKAIDEFDEIKSYVSTTNDEGEFLIANLPSGKYMVIVSSPGFRIMRQTVEVRSQRLVEMKITLEIGGASASVDVTSDSTSNMDMSDTAIATTVKKSSAGRIEFPAAAQNSTPRLRQYFPETLVWQPELITDKKGKAEMKFKFADNITTWKMYTIASTKNGKVGVTEKEITAFQPFFVDLDPPKFLTEGDEVFLPVQVRNYTEKRQRVDVTMARGDWFSFLGAERQQVDVEAGNSANAVFGFKAAAVVKDGKQRVTAVAQTDSDAIEKPVTVRPNGQEIVKTDSKVFNGNAAFDVNFPANALPKTQKAELKIYPNLYSHVAESVEGLLERPYGCGEQTISSTYPNLMILKFVKSDSALAKKAKRYLQKGYERLLGYQIADGGFSYWGGKDAGDIGLTAYALRFLTDASSKIDVDQEVVKKAEAWLLKQQSANGGWIQKYRWENNDDPNRSKITTTYVARSLGMLAGLSKLDSTQTATKNDSRAQALTKALDYLKTRNAEIDEPYALALYGLASLDAGNAETATAITKRLEKMAISEDGAVYWKLETNTPFYGWGTAGRIETTALVLQLLLRDSNGKADAARKDLISKAALFLLKNKDRYGVWYSTQTTINVLDAFLAALGGESTRAKQSINVAINGTPLAPIDVEGDRIEPVIVDVTGELNATDNRIEIRSSAESPLMSQIVASHYIDWKDADLSARTVNQSRALRLDYKCDKPTPTIMEEVSCSVEAERIGFQGYGMLLAEIGTPPGADVSRESLEKAIESDWSISRYDILPDRIVIYMWSKPGGTKFNFKFKPRYGINAQTPSSVVYDYYNPEAQATVAPLRFNVK